ncbi:MAG: hypothetical protein ACOC5T_10035, partial [Elusimicrobiota bacterium]
LNKIIAIINNNASIPNAPKSAYKIFISNGIVPSQEYPVPGGDRYVSVSEEVKSALGKKGYDSTIIRNGIDCERFNSTKPIHKKLKNVLVISNKQSAQKSIFQIINEACKELNLKITVLGLNFGTAQWNVEEFINQNDLVISLGRGALEGMACKRNVLICDYQGIDGMINNKSYLEIRKNNFSGRRYRGSISKDIIIKELKKYNYKQGERNRKLILQHHNINNTVQNYLDLYKYRELNI